MKLEITTYNHFKRLWFLIIYFILFIGVLYYTFNIKYMVVVCILALGIFTFPTLYIHINYFKYVKNKILFLEETYIKIQSLETNIITVFNLSDINNIKLFMSGTRIARIGSKVFAFEDYYYFEIELNNEKIIINSLYNNYIDDILKQKYPSIEIEVVNTYYPLIV